MPQAVRQEVRDFHKVKIYVSDPAKLKSAQEDDLFEDSTFLQSSAFKVAPPLPTFEVSTTYIQPFKSMRFPKTILQMLGEGFFEFKEPTPLQVHLIPILLE